MTMETSQASNPGSSLVAKVKALLMRAWRERWNEVQWGIQLKKAVAAAPGSDTRELAGKKGNKEGLNLIPCQR